MELVQFPSEYITYSKWPTCLVAGELCTGVYQWIGKVRANATGSPGADTILFHARADSLAFEGGTTWFEIVNVESPG